MYTNQLVWLPFSNPPGTKDPVLYPTVLQRFNCPKKLAKQGKFTIVEKNPQINKRNPAKEAEIYIDLMYAPHPIPPRSQRVTNQWKIATSNARSKDKGNTNYSQYCPHNPLL